MNLDKYSCDGQMTIFDWMPESRAEPEVGTIIREHGQVLCRIMRPSYIGKKVCIDVSTESKRNMFRVGILEKIIPAFYWHYEGGTYRKVDTERAIIFTGKKQRSLITFYPGINIYEVLPWDAYPKRMAAIRRSKNG